MKVRSETPMELVIGENTTWFSYPFLAVAVALSYWVWRSGHTWLGYIPGGVFLVLGLGCLFENEVIFDGVRRQMRRAQRRLFLVSSKTIAFDDIRGVLMESDERDEQLFYRLTLLTTNGPAPISDSFNASERLHIDLRKKILSFLHMEGGDTDGVLDEASIRLLLSQGRKAEAIQLLRSTKNIRAAAARQQVEAVEARVAAK